MQVRLDEMAVFLVTHRHDPAWKAYVDILPTTMTTPLFWDVADLEWLQSGHVRRVVDDADQELRDTFAGISEHLPGMSFAEFKLALAQVTSTYAAWANRTECGTDMVEQRARSKGPVRTTTRSFCPCATC